MKIALFLFVLFYTTHFSFAQNANEKLNISNSNETIDLLDTICECNQQDIIINDSKLEGYLDKSSYKIGDIVKLYAHTLSNRMTVELIYHDVADLIINKTSNVCVKKQNYSACAYKDGCNWDPNLFYKLDDNLKSGYYSFKLITNKNRYSIPFVISPDTESLNKIAVLASTNTWHAYNEWGGGSFYKLKNEFSCKQKFSSILATNRPNIGNNIYTNKEAHLFSSERILINWLTLNNYAYDVIGDDDLDSDSLILQKYKVVIINSHSEYWTEKMYDHLENFVNSGGSILSLGANQVYWKVIRKDNQIECMKFGDYHTLSYEKGGKWRTLSRPESNLLGVEFTNDGIATYAPFKVVNDTHWIFNGTNLKNGELFGKKSYTGKDQNGASGHETDKMTIHSPTNIVLLAKGQNPSKIGLIDFEKGGAEMTFYDHPAGGGVFAVGSITFNGALPIDKNLSMMLNNVLINFLKR